MKKYISLFFIFHCFFQFFYGVTDVYSSEKVSGLVKVDGSSTVFPILEAIAEEFLQIQPDVRTTVGVSGTGGGFKKFLVDSKDNLNTDINNASRPIKASEIETAKKLGIEFIELPIAFDGITVVVSHDNDFVDYLTVDELNKIWRPQNSENPEEVITKWSQIRDGWPDEPIELYGPGTDSGTFDYFTEAINGDGGLSRTDYTASEDDNVLVKGVGSNKNALGYFGYAYYVNNKKTVRSVPILDRNAKEPVSPSNETINKGAYTPLSRPVFIYVNAQSLERPEVNGFVLFLLNKVAKIAYDVGYIPLPDDVYQLGVKFIQDKVTGSKFSGVKSAGKNLTEIMKSN